MLLATWPLVRGYPVLPHGHLSFVHSALTALPSSHSRRNRGANLSVVVFTTAGFSLLRGGRMFETTVPPRVDPMLVLAAGDLGK